MRLSRCSSLAKIELTIDNSSDSMVWVDATYHYFEPVFAQCPAPAWSSDREGLTVHKTNPFRAGFARLTGGMAVLKAEGPNGVNARIDLDLSSNSLRATAPVPGVCDTIGKVMVQVVSGQDDATVVLKSYYEYDGPVVATCMVAPAWSADRRGLTVNPKNAFEASIPVSGSTLTTVTAAAPNGVLGNATF
jgi:hypothetical protein